jgi:hypothetical protein
LSVSSAREGAQQRLGPRSSLWTVAPCAERTSCICQVAIFIPHPFIAACKPHLDSAGEEPRSGPIACPCPRRRGASARECSSVLQRAIAWVARVSAVLWRFESGSWPWPPSRRGSSPVVGRPCMGARQPSGHAADRWGGPAGIAVGGQNCISAQKGAFTGATSTSMIKSLGCPHMLVGHSERRTLFRMDDESVRARRAAQRTASGGRRLTGRARG